MEQCGEARAVEVVVEPEAAGLGVRVAFNTYAGPPVAGLDSARLDSLVRELLDLAPRRYSLEGLRSDPVARAYRDFYWRIGVDPTKTRPSGEALVRRLLRGRFPRVNPVVDAGNIASAMTLVPIGIYDLAKLEPPLRIGLSSGGEEFHPIGGKPYRLGPGLPILVDSRGLVMHLYPHRDSIHTAVGPETRAVIAVAAGVPGVGAGLLREAITRMEEALALLGWKPCGVIRFAP